MSFLQTLKTNNNKTKHQPKKKATKKNQPTLQMLTILLPWVPVGQAGLSEITDLSISLRRNLKWTLKQAILWYDAEFWTTRSTRGGVYVFPKVPCNSECNSDSRIHPFPHLQTQQLQLSWVRSWHASTAQNLFWKKSAISKGISGPECPGWHEMYNTNSCRKPGLLNTSSAIPLSQTQCTSPSLITE